MRHTSSHTRNRRSHHALKNRVIVEDKESKALRLPHRLDESTGMYRGKLIAPQKVKAVKAKAHKHAEGDHDHHADHGHDFEHAPKAKPSKPKKTLTKVTQQRSRSRNATGE